MNGLIFSEWKLDKNDCYRIDFAKGIPYMNVKPNYRFL